jgi:hypothetical protein
MPYQEISATVTDKQMQTVKDALTAIETALPFLISLTDQERKKLRKTGPERLPFVQGAGVAAQDNPDILPKTFDADGFENAVALFSAMTEINTIVSQLSSKIDDTRLAVGVEALSGASDVYNYVKAAATKTPGLKPVADQLGQLFQKAVATRRANQKVQAAAKTAK